MNVTAIFDSHYEGELAGAIWILDTAPNRVRFGESTGLDPNSALFSTKSHDTPKSTPVRIIWSIMDHHPDFEKIVVIGVDHDASISKKLKKDCETEASSEGIICWRGNGN